MLMGQLRVAKKNIFFFTNNSSRSLKDYIRKLSKFGFEARAEEIIMSTHTLISYLKTKKIKSVYLLGTPAMRKMLAESGIRHSTQNPKAVVVGFDKTITYQKLLEACRFVDRGLPYIVTHPDYFCPTDIGPEPDCGSFAKVIELTTKRLPLAVLGKPHPSMIVEALRRSRAKKSEVILVGDRLQTDIEMGKRSKIDTLLVLTGETQLKDLKKSKTKPSYILRSVQSLVCR